MTMRTFAVTVACIALVACGKKPADVEGVWEIDIDKSTDSIAADPADLALDPRIQRIKSMARGLVPPGDRAEIVQARKMELRPELVAAQIELELTADGKVVLTSTKKGVRTAKPAESWELVSGKVVIDGGKNTFVFDGSLLKGALFDGHPGAAYLKKK